MSGYYHRVTMMSREGRGPDRQPGLGCPSKIDDYHGAPQSSTVASLLSKPDRWYMFRRFEKLCALWLVAQILLPFTAPFPVFDLSDLLGGAQHHGAPFRPVDSRVHGDYAYAPPLVTPAGRLKIVVASTLDALNGIRITPVVIPLSRPFAATFGGQQRSPQIQPTILRL